MQANLFDDIIKKDVLQVFADFETTGLDYRKNEIITGCLIITRNGREVDKIVFNSKPVNWNWDTGSEKIHGISYNTAFKFPPPIEQAEAIYKRLKFHLQGNNKYSFWGHYIMGFDYNFFKAYMNTHYKQDAFQELFYGVPFSTIEVLKYLVNNKKVRPVLKESGRPSYKLNDWCKRLSIPLIHHDAESDCYACLDIYNACEKLLGTNLFHFMR